MKKKFNSCHHSYGNPGYNSGHRVLQEGKTGTDNEQ